MLKKKIIAIATAGMLAVATSAFAGNVGPGLGHIVCGDKEGMGWDLLGSFLNGLFYNQLFAISFGTSL